MNQLPEEHDPAATLIRGIRGAKEFVAKARGALV
jgi:hypothetical protein